MNGRQWRESCRKVGAAARGGSLHGLNGPMRATAVDDTYALAGEVRRLLRARNRGGRASRSIGRAPPQMSVSGSKSTSPGHSRVPRLTATWRNRASSNRSRSKTEPHRRALRSRSTTSPSVRVRRTVWSAIGVALRMRSIVKTILSERPYLSGAIFLRGRCFSARPQSCRSAPELLVAHSTTSPIARAEMAPSITRRSRDGDDDFVAPVERVEVGVGMIVVVDVNRDAVERADLGHSVAVSLTFSRRQSAPVRPGPAVVVCFDRVVDFGGMGSVRAGRRRRARRSNVRGAVEDFTPKFFTSK